MRLLSALRSLASLAAGSLAALAAFAHDPGLSTLDVTLQADGSLVATLELDADDAAAAGIAGHSAAAPSGTPLITLSLDGTPVPLGTGRVETQADGDVTVTFRAGEGRAGRSLKVHSSLPGSLPRGHRQYLRVHGDGSLLGETLLSSARAGAEFPLQPGQAGAAPSTEHHASGSALPSTFGSFVLLGIEHLVTGYDHLLFLGALLLAASSFRQVAALVTVFTLAHSLTLGLSVVGGWSAPPEIVEPVIAASVAAVGIENLLLKRPPSWRLLLVGAFGLVHGLGFAGALSEAGIGSGAAAAIPLLGFNLGLEAAQIAIAAAVTPLLAVLRAGAGDARTRLTRWGSAAIAAAGSFWCLERLVT